MVRERLVVCFVFVLAVLFGLLVQSVEGSVCDEYSKACECSVHDKAKSVILHR